MASYYDDNFGWYEDMDDPDNREFYFRNQRRSVRKKCSRCGRMVKLLPEYNICNSCADKIEKGLDF